MDVDYRVTQSNRLIDARHTQPLSAREQKIVLTIISKIQPNDKDFHIYEMYIKDFHEMLGLEGREHYTQIKEVVKGLMTKVIEIPRGNDSWLVTHWASHIEYKTGEGKIEFAFDPKLKPYLLHLKEAFTSYRLSNILSLKSAYSIRLYELMKKWEYLGSCTFNLSNLKEKLGVHENKYPQYANLKQRVLNPSLKELNEKTDVQVDFKEFRKGRKVVKIEFIIRHCKEKEITIDKPKKPPFDDVLFERLNELADFEFPPSAYQEAESIAKDIYGESDYIDQLERLIKVVNLRVKQSAITNPAGLLIYIIRDKKNVFDRGLSPKFEDTSVEVIPDWFRDRNKPEQPKTAEQIKKEEAETEELKKMMAEFLANES